MAQYDDDIVPLLYVHHQALCVALVLRDRLWIDSSSPNSWPDV